MPICASCHSLIRSAYIVSHRWALAHFRTQIAMIHTFVHLFVFAVLASGTDVTFKDCGSHEGIVDAVTIDPCANADRCTLQVGDTYSVGVKFTPNVTITAGEISGIAIIYETEVPLPMPEPDLCKLVSCPTKPGEQLVTVQDFLIDSTFPLGDLDLKVQASDKNETIIVCGQVSLKVVMP